MADLVLKPDGWPLLLEDCPPGFFVYEGQVCFKSEYGMNGIYNSAGEYFCAREIKVQPVVYSWENEE